MPTKRVRRVRSAQTGLTAYQLADLLDRELPEATDRDRWWSIVESDATDPSFAHYGTGRKNLWAVNRAHLLPEFIRDNPGRRPNVWWSHEAPREPVGTHPGCYYDGKLSLLRGRLGGIGAPAHERLALVPLYKFGVPSMWVGVDLDNPPAFESQPTYLRRHNLLSPAELRRLRPADFEPESVVDIFGADAFRDNGE